MEYKGGSIIKNLRKNMGISQEDMAKRLYMSQRQLSRVENGEAELDWMEFIIAFSSLGISPDDFWIMYLDYSEFQGYMQYQQVRRHMSTNNRQEALKSLNQLEKNPLSKHDFMAQFVLAMSCILDEMEIDDRMRGLHEALSISIVDFDIATVNNTSLTYNEIMIINELAMLYNELGDTGHSIDLLYCIVNAFEQGNMRMTQRDKKLIIPTPMVHLFRLLMNEGRYDEAAKICEMVLQDKNKTRNYSFHPEAAYTLALCFKHIKKSQNEYIPLLVRAHHAAHAMGNHKLATEIKEAYHEVTSK